MVRVRILEIEKVAAIEGDELLRVSYQILDNNFVSPVAFFTIKKSEAEKGGVEKVLREIVEAYKSHMFTEKEVR